MPRNIPRYNQTLVRCKTPFPCDFCKIQIPAKDYEKHCKIHGLKPHIQCVWCKGEKQWEYGHKEYQIDAHVMECFKKFILKHCPPVRMAETSIPEAPETFSKFPCDLICEALDMFGRSRLSNLHPLAYELFEILPSYPMELTYQDSNLNLAASYVRYYEAEKRNMDFYHVMIRATAMNSAIRALGLYEDDQRITFVKFLPFSCWCDGGKYREAMYRQHRHMIAVVPKGRYFQGFWNQIDAMDRPNHRYRCKNSQRIRSALHLINTMGYLCQRPSKCNFTFKKGNAGDDDEYEEEELGEGTSQVSRQNHFYIFTALPKMFKMVAALQREGGIEEHVDQTYKNINPAKLPNVPIYLVQGKWRLKFRYIEGIPMDMVLPVSKKFKPVPYVTQYFVYLTHHRKFYFDQDPRLEALDEDAWLQEQGRCGNLFYHVMGDTLWTPSPYHQRYINDVKPLWDLNEKLKKDLEEKDRVIEEKDRVIKEKDRLIEENYQIIQEKNYTIEEKNHIIEAKNHIIEETRRMASLSLN